jgi:hypothetical protein
MDNGTLVLMPIVGILASFTAAILIVYFTSRSRQRRIEVQAEMQAKLIDRFGTAPELIAFLQSEPGRQFANGVQMAPTLLMQDRVLAGFRRAVVLTVLGLGFLFLTYAADRDFLIPAVIILALGIGYLLAGLLSLKMTKSAQVPASDPSRL